MILKRMEKRRTCHGRPNLSGCFDHCMLSSICLQESYNGGADVISLLHSAIEYERAITTERDWDFTPDVVKAEY